MVKYIETYFDRKNYITKLHGAASGYNSKINKLINYISTWKKQHTQY